MFYFWYRFVLDNASVIARGAVDIGISENRSTTE